MKKKQQHNWCESNKGISWELIPILVRHPRASFDSRDQLHQH